MEKREKNSRKTKTGTVISNKMTKTVIVGVTKTMQHPKYGKVIQMTKKYYAHNEDETIQAGDKVTINETRPLSKLKRWRVVEKIGA